MWASLFLAIIQGSVSSVIADDGPDKSVGDVPIYFADDELAAKAIEGMELIARRSVAQAADVLIPSPTKKEFQKLFVQQIEVAHSTFLKSLGNATGAVELVSDEIAGKSYRRLTIVEKFQFGLCGYRLVFYKTADGWQLVHFNLANAETLLTQNKDPKVEEFFSEPIAISMKIGEFFANDKVSEAMEEIKSYSIEPVQRSVTTELVERLSISRRLNTLNGNSSLREIEILTCEVLGKAMVKVHVVQRQKENGNNMFFTFFNVEGEWRICTFSFEQPTVPVFEARKDGGIPQ